MNENLLKWRAEFPALEACTHLISHSLGCMPVKARTYMKGYLDLWEKRSTTSWDVWLSEVEATENRISRISSAPEGTVAMRHNVSEIQAVMASCFDYSPKRNKVAYSSLQFPTVSYVWKAEERHGDQCYIAESDDGITVDTQNMCNAIDELLVPGVSRPPASAPRSRADLWPDQARAAGHEIRQCASMTTGTHTNVPSHPSNRHSTIRAVGCGQIPFSGTATPTLSSTTSCCLRAAPTEVAMSLSPYEGPLHTRVTIPPPPERSVRCLPMKRYWSLPAAEARS